MATVVLAVAAVALVTVVGCFLAGIRLLVVESGSMVPTLRVGDLVVSETVHPMAVHPGTIVTFRDVLVRDQLVTHRVVGMVPDGPVVHFITKGDANEVPERWSVPKDGTIGRALFTIPAAGRVLADLTTATARLVVVWLLAGWLALLGWRRIWGRRRRPHGDVAPALPVVLAPAVVLAPPSLVRCWVRAPGAEPVADPGPPAGWHVRYRGHAGFLWDDDGADATTAPAPGRGGGRSTLIAAEAGSAGAATGTR